MDKEEVWNKSIKIWEQEARCLRNLKKIINPGNFVKTVEAINQCRYNNGRVVTAGVGTSGAAAKKIAHTLSCIEVPSFFLSPGDGVHGALGAVQKGDVVIAVSKGGNTKEIVNILQAVSRKGAVLVGVTENTDSELAKASDIVLRVKVDKEPDPFNMLATASTMAVIAVFDAIAIALMSLTGYKREQFAVIHPGGAVGERLIKGEK